MGICIILANRVNAGPDNNDCLCQLIHVSHSFIIIFFILGTYNSLFQFPLLVFIYSTLIDVRPPTSKVMSSVL